MNEKLIVALKELNIIHRESTKLKSGEISEYYVDIKKAYGYPEVMGWITKGIINLFPERITCVAAAGYGGVPLASALSTEFDLKMTLVRDKPKNHGKGGWLDGHSPTSADKVAIVDDVFTTGGSLNKIIDIIKPTKAEIVGCYVVVKRGKGKLSVPVYHLLTAKDLL